MLGIISVISNVGRALTKIICGGHGSDGELALTRCQPGDQAVIIQARYAENVGLSVRVLRPARPTEYGPMWWIDVGEPRPGILNGVPGVFKEFIVPDAWLSKVDAA